MNVDDYKPHLRRIKLSDEQYKKLNATISADTISREKIRGTFRYAMRLYVATSGHGTYIEAAPLNDRRVFKGTITTYDARSRLTEKGDKFQGDAARRDPFGFYYGCLVKTPKGVEYVIDGPPVVFFHESNKFVAPF